MDPTLRYLRDAVLATSQARGSLRLRGAGTKDFYGEEFAGEVLDTRLHAGIVDYDPCELVLTARCGTRLSEIAAALATHAQCLGFEPPTFGGDPTIGGIVASGLSGPRRMQVGGARNFVLGATLLTADGQVLRFGGRVMKNVAGFDVARLLCGSLGILGLITEVSLRVLPAARAIQTLQFDMRSDEAISAFNRWCHEGAPVSATAWLGNEAWVRLSGSHAAVDAASARLISEDGGKLIDQDDASRWWRAVRDHELPFFANATSLWRVSLPATAAPLQFGANELIEWNGAARWQQMTASPTEVRERVAAVGGSALHWRGRTHEPMFHPLAAPVLDLHRRLKQRFDPNGLFNPGRLVAGV